jgi:hypothetical protein
MRDVYIFFESGNKFQLSKVAIQSNSDKIIIR